MVCAALDPLLRRIRAAGPGRSCAGAVRCGRGELMVKSLAAESAARPGACSIVAVPADLVVWAGGGWMSRLSVSNRTFLCIAQDCLGRGYRHMNLDLSQQMGRCVIAAVEGPGNSSAARRRPAVGCLPHKRCPAAQQLGIDRIVAVGSRLTGNAARARRSRRDRDVDDRQVEQCHEEILITRLARATLQGMARVRSGQAPPGPRLLTGVPAEVSRIKRSNFACTSARHVLPVLIVLRSQSRLMLEGRARTLSGPSPDLTQPVLFASAVIYGQVVIVLAGLITDVGPASCPVSLISVPCAWPWPVAAST